MHETSIGHASVVLRRVTALLAALAAGCSQHPSPEERPSEAGAEATSTRHVPSFEPTLKENGFPLPDAARAPGDPLADAGRAPKEPNSARTVSTVRLLSPGDPPRKRLLYSVIERKEEKLTIEMSTTESVEATALAPSETALPPLHVVVAVESGIHAVDGDVRYTWKVQEASLGTRVKVLPAMRAAMDPAVGLLRNVTGTGYFTPQGQSYDVSAAGPSDDVGGDLVPQVLQWLNDLDPNLPEEPVGLHARWQVTAASADGDDSTVEECTLTDLRGSEGTVHGAVHGSAPPTAALASLGSLVPSARAFRSTITRDTHFDLKHLAPQRTHLDGLTRLELGDDMGQRATIIIRINEEIVGTHP